MSNYDPGTEPTRLPPVEPVYSETVIVRRESNTGWWVAGGLAALVLLAVIWVLASQGRDRDDVESQARLAEAQAAQAQAAADSAVAQGQIAGAQQSLELARADAVRAQAEAVRAANEARAAEARIASAPPTVVIERAPAGPAPAVAPAGTPTQP